MYWTTRKEDVQRNITLGGEHYDLDLVLFVGVTIGGYSRRKRRL